nr:MAG TPA: oligoribonuclease [Caudoviricetes sp.]
MLNVVLGEKIDRRINYKIVLDCETCPMDKKLEKVEPSNMLVYDVGWVVTDKKGRVYRQRWFINKDIFEDEKELMKSAYYANKIPMYLDLIASGDIIVTTMYAIRETLKADMQDYNINEVYAHNMHFDYGSLNNTQRWLTKSKYRYFFPYGVEICDTLKMARQVIGTMPTYKRFCIENGYLTKNNQLRFTAEILNRFISKDNEFVEAHTGLQDVLIEKNILAYCYKQHKKMERKLWNN